MNVNLYTYIVYRLGGIIGLIFYFDLIFYNDFDLFGLIFHGIPDDEFVYFIDGYAWWDTGPRNWWVYRATDTELYTLVFDNYRELCTPAYSEYDRCYVYKRATTYRPLIARWRQLEFVTDGTYDRYKNWI